MSFDNRGMIRKRGHSIKGTKVLIRGEFVRKPRVSLLCFINTNGIFETFMTEGTFNRLKFFEHIRQLITSELIKFRDYNCREIYRKYGYLSVNRFNPGVAFKAIP